MTLATEAVMNGMNIEDTDVGYEHYICEWKNAHAYHLASRGNALDFLEALQESTYALQRSNKYPFSEHNWKETYAWVFARLGTDDTQRTRATEVVRELLADPSAPAERRELLAKKYSSGSTFLY